MGSNKFIDNVNDYIGKKINKWLVLEFSHSHNKSGQYWLCKCDCGTIQPIRTRFLVKGLCIGCKKCYRNRIIKNTSPCWRGGKFIPLTLLTRSKLSAKNRNLSFNITIEDLENQWLKQESKCSYTNIPLTLGKDTRCNDFNASLDRIDSSIGYEVNNIHWVLKEVNLMKMNLKEDRFLELCKIITNNYE